MQGCEHNERMLTLQSQKIGQTTSGAAFLVWRCDSSLSPRRKIPVIAFLFLSMRLIFSLMSIDFYYPEVRRGLSSIIQMAVVIENARKKEIRSERETSRHDVPFLFPSNSDVDLLEEDFLFWSFFDSVLHSSYLYFEFFRYGVSCPL